MSDEELRALARDPSAAGRLRHARALERLGRADEALAVLVAAREEPEVRRALVERPAWTHVHGDAGRTFFADVEPVRKKPRVRWAVDGLLDPGRAQRLHLDFVVSSLAVVATRGERSVFALDAVTGRTLWERDFEPRRDGGVTLEGDAVVLAGERAIVACDVWTGVERWKVESPEGVFVVSGGRVLALHRETLRASALPERSALWSVPVPMTGVDQAVAVYVAADLVVARTSGSFVGLRAATGERVFEHRGALQCLDVRGVVAGLADRGLTALDLEGRVMGPGHLEGRCVALGPRHFVAAVRAPALGRSRGSMATGDLFVAVDRASGAPGHTLGTADAWLAIALARDVFVSYSDALRATTLRGEPLWVLPGFATSEADVFAIAPGHRTLCTLARDGTVTCYEES